MDAVRSVLDQKDSPEHLEIIVVDDGSTDNTGEALAALPGEFGCFRREHSGVSAARNLGISLSRGEWIAFLDSRRSLASRQTLRPDEIFFGSPRNALLCQTEEIWIRNGRRINARKYHEKPAGYCFPLLLERCLVSPSAVVVHRGLFDPVGLFDESLPACEDYDLWLRIGCRFPIGLVEEPLVIKRGGHPDQLSANNCQPRPIPYRGHRETASHHCRSTPIRGARRKERWRKNTGFIPKDAAKGETSPRRASGRIGARGVGAGSLIAGQLSACKAGRAQG